MVTRVHCVKLDLISSSVQVLGSVKLQVIQLGSTAILAVNDGTVEYLQSCDPRNDPLLESFVSIRPQTFVGTYLQINQLGQFVQLRNVGPLMRNETLI